MIIGYDKKAEEYASVLQDLNKPMADRIGCLFNLQVVGTLEAVNDLIKAFDTEPRSDLLKHEICYSLG